MLRKLSPIPIGLLTVALLTSCAGWIGNDRRESNTEVILVSFGATNGEIAPCG